MCKAVKLIETINNAIKEVESEYLRLAKEEGRLNSMQQDLSSLHPFNVVCKLS
ncbi:MAG TPA: hypothetical protein VIM42_02705 [Clostridium sp.]